MPHQSNPALFKTLVASLPLPFLEAVGRGVPLVYEEARAEVGGSPLLDGPEALYALPHLRRAMVETLFRREAQRAGLFAVCKPNSRDSAQFTMVRADHIVLTASHATRPGGHVRAAVFRTEHAALNDLLEQGDFFPEALVEADAKEFGVTLRDLDVYCILLHGGETEGKVRPFLQFAFPAPEGGGYVDVYDLFDVLAAARALAAPQAPKEHDQAFPALKKVRKDGTSAEGET